MPDDRIADPEPVEQDERLALALIELKGDTGLEGTPEGGQRCGNCHFFLDRDHDLSYCWNEELRIVVGHAWSCDRWRTAGEPAEEPSEDDRRTARRLASELVEAARWATESAAGARCADCRFYLNPDETVSYCWHPERRIGVGFDHSCRWFELNPDRSPR